jgi:hypothetical protein
MSSVSVSVSVVRNHAERDQQSRWVRSALPGPLCAQRRELAMTEGCEARGRVGPRVASVRHETRL